MIQDEEDYLHGYGDDEDEVEVVHTSNETSDKEFFVLGRIG